MSCKRTKELKNKRKINERIRRATIAMKQAWSIGERLFKNDYWRRMKIFNTLVDSVVLYGAEIWAWRNDRRIDEIKKDTPNGY